MSGKPKLYIHMGTHRTATTSIQTFLFENRPRLQAQGVIYPFGVRRHNAEIRRIASGRGTASDLGRAILAAKPRFARVQSYLLSDEDVCFLEDFNLLAGLKDHFDLHFILFLRRQDLWIESWYMQNIKWQFSKKYCDLTFDEFFARRDDFFWIDYAATAQRLEALVGRSNLHLAIFEPGQMPQGPVAAFMDLAGIAADAAFVMPPHRNSSMTPLMTEFVRQLPLNMANAKFRGFIERACGRVDQAMHGEGKVSALYLDHRRRAEYMQGFAQGNKCLAQDYFGRSDLFFEPLPPSDAALADITMPVRADEMMTKFVAPMLREMIEARNKQDAEAAAAANKKK